MNCAIICVLNENNSQKKVQSVGIEPTLFRTRALSVRLNRSAKTAMWKTESKNDFMAQWQRVGFQTRRLGVRFPLRSFIFLFFLSNQKRATGRI